MPLYWFLLVIASLVCDAVPVPEVPLGRAAIASAGLLGGWAILVRLAARTATLHVTRHEVSRAAAASALGRQMEALRWIGLVMCVLVWIGFGLAGGLERLPLVEHSLALRGLLLLVPAVAMTMWSWACEHAFERAVRPAAGREPVLRHLSDAFRLQAAWLVSPILLLLVVLDVAHWGIGIDPAHGAWASGAICLVVLPLALPWILGRIWALGPMPDRAMDAWCHDLVRHSGIRGTRVAMWDTGGTVATAMIAGFVPGFRRLILSDTLVWRLPPAQVAMVILHEVAHVRRWHLQMRLLVLVPVWGVASLVTRALGESAWGDLAGITAGLLCSLCALRWMAYRTEYDADRYACRLAATLRGRVPWVPSSESAAARALADALLAVTADHPGSRRASWLHPSVPQRCEALARLASEAEGAGESGQPFGGLAEGGAIASSVAIETGSCELS